MPEWHLHWCIRMLQWAARDEMYAQGHLIVFALIPVTITASYLVKKLGAQVPKTAAMSAQQLGELFLQAAPNIQFVVLGAFACRPLGAEPSWLGWPTSRHMSNATVIEL